MTDSSKLPNAKVVDAIFRKWMENKERAAAANGELGERVQVQEQNNPAYTGAFRQVYNKIRYKAKTNELAARELADTISVAVEFALAAIDAEGHTGDLDKMARDKAQEKPQGSTPKDAMPLDEAEKAFEKTKHLAVVEGGKGRKGKADKADKPKPGRKPKADKTFSEEQREANEAGDAMARGEPLPADDDDEIPATNPANPVQGAEGTGTYKIVS